MKKLTILVAIVLFVAATPLCVFAAHLSQYDKLSNAIVFSVDVGSGLLAANSVGPFALHAGLKTTDDTTFKYVSINTPTSDTTVIEKSQDQSTSGYVSFIGTIHSAE